MQKCGKILPGAKRYSRPRGFNIAGASAPIAPAVPTPLQRDRRLVYRVFCSVASTPVQGWGTSLVSRLSACLTEANWRRLIAE